MKSERRKTMMAAAVYRPILLALALAAVLGAQTTPTFSMAPNPAPAGKAFALHLLSNAFTCATAFDKASADVSDGVITLSFTDKELPKGCMDMYNPYGPTFQLPALKAGSYQVKVNRLQLNAIVDAGILLVTDATEHKTWYLKERTTASDKAFSMQLLRDDVGNCQTSFSDETASVISGGIYASFVLENHPDRVCVMDVRPFGPSFSLPALKPGLYPVYPRQLMPCQVMEPMCLLPDVQTAATDSLVVGETAASLLSAMRAAAPKVELRGRTAYFTLPAAQAGIWSARLSTLDGRVLSASTIRVPEESGEADRQVSLSIDRAPAHALCLLRLTAPDGAQTSLPIVR
jgi:hypothetical protein